MDLQYILQAVRYGAFRSGWEAPCKEGVVWFKKAKTLEDLLYDPTGVDYRRWAAQVLRDQQLLEFLANDPNPGVRAAVKRNPFYKLLDVLVVENSAAARAGLRQNSHYVVEL